MIGHTPSAEMQKREGAPALAGLRAQAIRNTGRRVLSFPAGDRAAFAIGLVLTLLLVSFFSWRMVRNVTRDRALGPVPMSTPTPPPPPPAPGH